MRNNQTVCYTVSNCYCYLCYFTHTLLLLSELFSRQNLYISIRKRNPMLFQSSQFSLLPENEPVKSRPNRECVVKNVILCIFAFQPSNHESCLVTNECVFSLWVSYVYSYSPAHSKDFLNKLRYTTKQKKNCAPNSIDI